MGWYRPHTTLNREPGPGLKDKCIFCGQIKTVMRSDFVLEFSDFERETGNICKDCYVANSVKVYLD